MPTPRKACDARRSGAEPVTPATTAVLSVALVIWIIWIMASGASGAPASALCDAAAIRAAHESGVPRGVLMAITRTETGRAENGRLSPWPWTVNMEGKGRWFASRAEAQDYVKQHYDRGARSFDIGCFQINFRWHGGAFQSVETMFDPLENARYAAQFLARLHRELGDWSLAAGAYHSRSPDFARRYRLRFDRIRASMTTSPEPAVVLSSGESAPPPRDLMARRRPLVPTSGEKLRRRGSLVPISSTGRALISLAAGS